MSRPLRTSERRLALLLGDAAAVTVAVLLALWTWSLTAGFPFNLAFLRARVVWLLAVPFWLVLLIPTRDARSVLDIRETAAGVIRAAVALLIIYLGAFFFAGGDRLPRLVALYLFWDATLLVFGWRIVALWSLTRAPFSRRLLIVGSGHALSTAMDVLTDASFRDADIVGVATNDPARAEWKVVGSPAEVDQIARRLDVTDLIVALEGPLDDVDGQWVQRLLRCQESGTHVVRLAQLYEDTLGRVPVEHVDSSWLVTNFFDVARFRDASPLAKRILDVAVATVLAAGGLLLAPAIALAILFESGRPVLYRQARLGRGGRLFQMTKFRTMKHDAEPDGQAQWSTLNDARVTRVGRVSSAHAPRRAAESGGRPARRDEHGGTAPRTAAVRRAARARSASLPRQARRRARTDRLGAGELCVWRLGSRRGGQARVRPLLRQASIDRVRCADSPADRRDDDSPWWTVRQ